MIYLEVAAIAVNIGFSFFVLWLIRQAVKAIDHNKKELDRIARRFEQ